MFNVGDKVQVLDTVPVDSDARNFIGLTGKVVEVYSDNDFPYMVEFNLYSRCPFSESELRKVK